MTNEDRDAAEASHDAKEQRGAAMTIQRAIELLEALKAKHGDIEVLFDCEHCKKVTRPGRGSWRKLW